MGADMALQVIVSPFLGVLFDNLNSLIRNEVGLVWGVDKEMKKLASTLSTIRDVLEDAEEKQDTEKVVANWLLKLRDLAYDADDILDEWETEARELKLGTEDVTFSKQEKSGLGLGVGVSERRPEHYHRRETSLLPTDPHVYGREEEQDYIVKQIIDNEGSEAILSVHPIVGIGGLGKTTLAQVCYNDLRVQEHFDVRVWVCVSDDFDVKRLTKAVVVSLGGDVQI